MAVLVNSAVEIPSAAICNRFTGCSSTPLPKAAFHIPDNGPAWRGGRSRISNMHMDRRGRFGVFDTTAFQAESTRWPAPPRVERKRID
jgi:hypothetical protein